MILYRLDATHELDGAFTRFYAQPCEGADAENRFSLAGWICDLYPAEFGPLEPAEVDGICRYPWPNAPEEQLLELLRGLIVAATRNGHPPLALAAKELDRLIDRKLHGG